MLTPEYLEGLVKLVNAELDSTHGLLKDKLDAIDLELEDVRARLAKLYDVLETGKLSLDDLSPRIKELKARRHTTQKQESERAERQRNATLAIWKTR